MDNNKVGEFIKEQRKKNNLTQKQLADLLQCTDKAISRWETGKGLPEVSFLLPLSKVLGVSINEILLGEIIEKEDLPEKSDDLIIETLVINEKKVNNLHSIIYFLIICLSALFILGFPLIAQAGDEMGVVFAMVGSTPIISLILGLTNIKNIYKLTYPLVNIVLYFLSWLFLSFWSKDFEALLLYSVIIATVSFVGVLIGMLIKTASSVIIKHIRNK